MKVGFVDVLVLFGIVTIIFMVYDAGNMPQEKAQIIYKKPKHMKMERRHDRVDREIDIYDDRMIHDPLLFPSTRVKRSYLHSYSEMAPQYYDLPTRDYGDSEKQIGILIKNSGAQQVHPMTIYEKPSITNRNKYVYYIQDTSLPNNTLIKVPLDSVSVNGVSRDHISDFGIDQLENGDILKINDYIYDDSTEFKLKLHPRESGLRYNPMVAK